MTLKKQMSTLNKALDDLEIQQQYEIGNTVFIIEPSFKSDGYETLGSLLLKLMQNEVNNI